MKNFATSALVRALARGESCPVNAIVHIFVNEIGELRVVGLDLFREKVDRLVLGEVVKPVVEHPANVVLAIVDNPLCFCVPEDGHSYASLIIRVGRRVGLAQELEAVDWISGFKMRAWRDLAGRIAKCPAKVISNRINYGQADNVFETFKFPNNNCPASPWAGQ